MRKLWKALGTTGVAAALSAALAPAANAGIYPVEINHEGCSYIASISAQAPSPDGYAPQWLLKVENYSEPATPQCWANVKVDAQPRGGAVVPQVLTHPGDKPTEIYLIAQQGKELNVQGLSMMVCHREDNCTDYITN